MFLGNVVLGALGKVLLLFYYNNYNYFLSHVFLIPSCIVFSWRRVEREREGERAHSRALYRAAMTRAWLCQIHHEIWIQDPDMDKRHVCYRRSKQYKTIFILKISCPISLCDKKLYLFCDRFMLSRYLKIWYLLSIKLNFLRGSPWMKTELKF